MTLYQSHVVCGVCRITPRTLDYWITTEVIRPSHFYEPKDARRILFLFTFDDLVRIRIVKSLRDAGVSLQQVRHAISHLRQKHGRMWQAEWIVTDGKHVFRATPQDQVFESLSKRETGQLVFSVIALNQAKKRVAKTLTRKRFQPFDEARYDGKVRTFRRRRA